jgi:MFS family permease
VLSDFYGRRKVILSGAFVFASAPFLYFLVNAPWQLAIVRAYHGLATAIFGPVAIALVADLFAERRGESMGWYSSSRLVGRALAPTVSGAVIYRYGYRNVYFACGAAGVLALLLASLIPIKRRVKPASASFSATLKEMGEGLKEIGKSRGIMITSCAEAIEWLSYGALETFLPLYCVAFGMNVAKVGMLFTIQVTATALTNPMMGRLSDKYGRRLMISVGLFLGAIALSMIPFFKTFWALIPIAILFGISFATVTCSTAAFVSDLAKAGSYGSALGVMSTIMDVGQASGPIASGILVSAFSYKPMFLTVAGILILLGGSFPVLVGKPKATD